MPGPGAYNTVESEPVRTEASMSSFVSATERQVRRPCEACTRLWLMVQGAMRYMLPFMACVTFRRGASGSDRTNRLAMVLQSTDDGECGGDGTVVWTM